MAFYSSDLSKGLLADGPQFGDQGLCGVDDPPLVAGEPTGFQNLFVRDNTTDTYQLVDVTPPGVVPTTSGSVCQQGNTAPTGCDAAHPLAASSDLSRVVFDETAQLTADAPGAGADDLYEWSGGVVHLVTYLPDGTAVQGSFPIPAGQFAAPGANYREAVSTDGSRVVFIANGDLYMRVNASGALVSSPPQGAACAQQQTDGCTVQVDAPQGGSGPGGGGQFMWASSDGSQVFFTDDASAGLTSDTIAGSGQNLYRYDLSTGQLSDLTPATDAGVLGVSGASGDGSYLYFVADGALKSTPNDQGSSAQGGQSNLYMAHAGTLSFIATLAPVSATNTGTNDGEPFDACDWTAGCLSARVSSDGRFIAFNSIESLTGYDNVPADPSACDIHVPAQASGAPCAEIYLYDATAGTLNCVSCNPNGEPPTGSAWFGTPIAESGELNNPFPEYLPHSLSDSGQVFFDSPDPLLPGATDGADDAYEYEDGQLHLLLNSDSSQLGYCDTEYTVGAKRAAACFLDASPSGNDIFILSYAHLVGQATGVGPFIYDVRVDGGFPAPPTPPTACSGDGCRATLSGPPATPTAASVSFAGPDDLARPASTVGKVRVLTRMVHGSTFLLQIKVPGAGRIAVRGARVRTVRRVVARAGTYKLKVTLAAGAARTMRTGGRNLKLIVRVAFAAVGGPPSTVMVPLTVQHAITHRAARARRQARRSAGGER